MNARIRTAFAAVVALSFFIILAWSAPASAQRARRVVTVAPRSLGQLREWDQRIDRMLRAGELRVRQTREDPLVPGRTHVRADQYFKGVRVFGADVARQLQRGATVSVFGTIYDDIALDPSPVIDDERARAVVQARSGAMLDEALRPELVVLPLDAGGYALTWRLRAATAADARQYFVDARTGAILFEYSDRERQTAVGRARGVLGDTKKISVTPSSGRFLASDQLRPPSIRTYDMQSDPIRTTSFLDTRFALSTNDLGSDSDNDWTDGALDDAHVYAGWTYDYYFKRFGRHGLDNGDLAITSLVHPVRRSDIFTLFDEFPDFFVNAFYDGNGVMLYGEGLPAGFTIDGQTLDFLAGALDVVAHELTHGVTQYTSDLIYLNESGALNEAFSDMMGTSVEFFFQKPGTLVLQADYLIGEDVVRPGGLRSMANPGVFGDPDHYSRRFLGTSDNGGVHSNSGIANHAFYLAIEGGTNRTSGLSVQGVGPANREQIEKIVYRTWTQLLPANATFAIARAASIQAARDLYGANSAAERAITQAWTAVGVN